MARSIVVRPADRELRQAVGLAVMFALVKLAVQVACTLWEKRIGYGYFRDEFYYLMCGRHLAWGYVDHGPVVAVQARLGELLFGDGLVGIRMLSAVGGALRIFLTGMLCWALRGRRSAQALAMLTMMTAPLYLAIDGYLSMNSWESAFWMTCLLALLMMLRDDADAVDRRWMWWTLLGVSTGLGLLNKPSMTFFLVCVAIALLLTPQRRLLLSRQAAWGIALMILIALPNVVWQMHHHWPTLEFLHNGRVQGKNIRLNPLMFVLNQLLVMGPWNAFVFLPGLVHLLRRPDRRWMGYTFVLLLGLMTALGAKDYYFAPVYPMLFAAGGIAWEAHDARRRHALPQRLFAWPMYSAVVVLLTALFLPSSEPVLRPAAFQRYAKAMHLPSTDTENGKRAPLPQFYADRFGWQEEVDTVTRIVDGLSPEDRAKAGIFCSNYGEAGALEVLGHGLPPVISHHNNYWIWGPRGVTGEVMIVITNADLNEMKKYYRDVRVVGRMNHPLAMPYEHKNIYLARGRYVPEAADWAEGKSFL